MSEHPRSTSWLRSDPTSGVGVCVNVTVRKTGGSGGIIKQGARAHAYVGVQVAAKHVQLDGGRLAVVMMERVEGQARDIALHRGQLASYGPER